jgi:predicted outer membrane repeat protein
LISTTEQSLNIIALGKLLLVTVIVFGTPVGLFATNSQTTCQVPSPNYQTIQSAIQDASCNSIQIASGIFVENLTIDRNVMLTGSGEESTSIDGNSTGTSMRVSGTVTISNLSVQNGGAPAGNNGTGIVFLNGRLTLENVTVKNNQGRGAGGIEDIGLAGSVMILRNVTVRDNEGEITGGIKFGAESILENVTITGNSGNLSGGLSLSSIGFQTNDKVLTMNNVVISQNSSAISGGGIFIGGGRQTGELHLTMRNVRISGNSAIQGGGLRIDPKSILNLENVIIEENIAQQGAGIFVGTLPSLPTDASIAEFNNVTFENNIASEDGGAIFNASGRTLSISDVFIHGNSARSGAGIWNDGELSMSDVTLENNEAFIGGGIVNNGNFSVRSTTFQNNGADLGGAIFNDGILSILNATFRSNSAATAGGSIYNNLLGSLNLSFVTIDSGSAILGGGIYNVGTLSTKNSIIANSLLGGNCAFDFISEGHNLSSDASCSESLAEPSDVNDIDPLLDPSGLTVNGGFTATIALLADSIAIDAIALEDCTNVNGDRVNTDQRGTNRPQGQACDIGAFEGT